MGTVVTEIALSDTHKVSFNRLDSGRVVMIESGAQNDQKVDAATLGSNLSDAYTALQALTGLA
ncbi:MAG TPA: hypothetical protein VGM29_03175, partial [Polyangiaceae bacterium]